MFGVCDVQDLQLALEKARSALQDREEQLKEGEQERRRQDEDREKTIRELETSLQTKERLMEVRNTTCTNTSNKSCEGHIAGMHILCMLHIPDRNLHS